MIVVLRRRSIELAATVAVAFLAASSAQAKPVKLQTALHITNNFEYAESTAVAPGGNVYVADRGKHRIQEFTSTGQFVLMFGWDVNETKIKEGAPQEQRNVCTASSGDKCKEGTEGTAVEHFNDGTSITVDPSTNDVYVHDFTRVDRYTGAGRFIWELGKKVNLTGGNLCTAAEISSCGPGERSPLGSTEPGAFKSETNPGGQQLAFGGPEELLYVGDERRVQEFDREGKFQRELPLTSISPALESAVTALTLDAGGEVYLTYRIGLEFSPIVHVFDSSDKEINSFPITPREQGSQIEARGLALDGEGHLAVSFLEIGNASNGGRGLLLDAATGHVITGFATPSNTLNEGISFDLTKTDAHYGYLYLASQTEVVGYNPVAVAELVAKEGAGCEPGSPNGSDATEECTLEGEVNPEGVEGTEVWFEWGLTEALGESVPVPPISVPNGEVLVPVTTQLADLRPNQAAIRVRLAAYDKNSKPPEEPEPLSSETVEFSTPFVAPAVPGAPSAPFVRSSSAVVFAELNPENASTSYAFQYAPESACEEAEAQLGHAVTLEECPGMVGDPVGESSAYGQIGATSEVTGLQPNAKYRYRLVAIAKSEIGGTPETLKTTGAEASFVTATSAVPTAVTGGPLSVGKTTATITGNVNSDGEAAGYSFELGVYAGAQTQYATVFSGPAGGDATSTEERLGLTGLQPGTTYAYRITVKSGFTPGGEAVMGQPVTFTTQGAPVILQVPEEPPLLTAPSIRFPKESASTPKSLTRPQKLGRALKACKRKPKRARGSCERRARAKYGPVRKGKRAGKHK